MRSQTAPISLVDAGFAADFRCCDIGDATYVSPDSAYGRHWFLPPLSTTRTPASRNVYI